MYSEGIHLLLRCLVLHSSDTLSLLGNTGSTALASSLNNKSIRIVKQVSTRNTHPVFHTASLHLVGEDLGAALLGLGLVDVLHQDTLVLEDVTLRLLVEDMVPVVT